MNRPVIGEYQKPAEFVRDMILFRKTNEKSFSVHKAVKTLRRISPTLVSLVAQAKRPITLDRVDEFAKLLNLNASEKTFLRNWVGQLENHDFLDHSSSAKNRKEASLGLLSDWINVYVKDFFQIEAVQKNPELIEKQLLSMSNGKRISKSIQFLLKEGYLRKTLDGKIVLETRLAVTEPPVPSARVRQFHKSALKLAQKAIDLYPSTERWANTLTIPMNEENYEELIGLIQDFGEQLKEFAARKQDNGNRMYQLVINLSPVGGKIE